MTVSTSKRRVVVKGRRGTLTKSFSHLSCEITKLSKGKLRVDVWFATRKQLACLRTICSHIENLFKGVQYVSVWAARSRSVLVVVYVKSCWIFKIQATQVYCFHWFLWRVCSLVIIVQWVYVVLKCTVWQMYSLTDLTLIRPSSWNVSHLYKLSVTCRIYWTE